MAYSLRGNQDRTFTGDITEMLTRDGRSAGDVERVVVTMKRLSDAGVADDLAAYYKNSIDHPSDVDLTGTTITFTIRTSDFITGVPVVPDVPYVISPSLEYDDDNNNPKTTFEADVYTNTSNIVTWLQEGVDTIDN